MIQCKYVSVSLYYFVSSGNRIFTSHECIHKQYAKLHSKRKSSEIRKTEEGCLDKETSGIRPRHLAATEWVNRKSLSVRPNLPTAVQPHTYIYTPALALLKILLQNRRFSLPRLLVHPYWLSCRDSQLSAPCLAGRKKNWSLWRGVLLVISLLCTTRKFLNV